MIPLTDPSWQTQSWQSLVKQAITRIDDLTDALNLPSQPHFSDFPIFVPQPYLSRIERGNPNDPLLRQVISQVEETQAVDGFNTEPLKEHEFSKGQGVLHKYQSRLLIVTTGACAIHCRYCFRRHFPYQAFQPGPEAWTQILAYAQENTAVQEIILSGGDPLMLNDQHLSRIVEAVSKLDHVTTLRLHTRMPVVIPQRITHQLVALLKQSNKQVVLVTHVNHGNEIDPGVISALTQLRHGGITLLNQSVLLKGVNDNTDALAQLSRQLFSAGVLPYYLHLLDPVAGAAHFDVTEARGVELINTLRDRLPGYLVPRLARETPGSASKTVVA